jgi:hypothetical protein
MEIEPEKKVWNIEENINFFKKSKESNISEEKSFESLKLPIVP